MDAELMDRMELAARVQASSKRVEEAGKDMSCGEAVHG